MVAFIGRTSFDWYLGQIFAQGPRSGTQFHTEENICTARVDLCGMIKECAGHHVPCCCAWHTAVSLDTIFSEECLCQS